MRAWRTLFMSSVLSRSNAAAGRAGRMASRALFKMRVCSARLARSPKSGMRCRKAYQSGPALGKPVLPRGMQLLTARRDIDARWMARRSQASRGPRVLSGGGRRAMRWLLPAALAMSVACMRGRVSTVDDGGSGDVLPDGGTSSTGGGDGGVSTGGQFGGPGPWPVGNATYGAADGIREAPVV